MDPFFIEAKTVGAAPAGNLSDGHDRLFVLAAFGLGLFLTEAVFSVGFGLSVSAFILLFYGAAFAYLGSRPGGLKSSGWPLLIAIGVIALCYGLYNNVVLQVLNIPLLCLLTALLLTAMTGNRLYEPASAGTVTDILNALIVLPIVNVPAPFSALAHIGHSERRKQATPVLVGLAIGLPVLLIVGALLVSADALLDRLVNDFLRDFRFSEHIGRVIFAVVLTVPLHGLLYALRHSKAEAKPADISRAQRADPRTFATVMCMINTAYLLFIAVQFGYLFNGFSRLLPQGFTYADYARRGFGELVVVITINLVILCLSLLISKRTAAGGRFLIAMETLLVAMTLLLCASEMAKMALYMDAYGLTQLRVYVTWFIMLCAAFFVALLLKIYLPRFRLIRFCAGAFVAWFLALNLADVDGRIAQYNVNAYRAGQMKTIDIHTLEQLSDSMVPYLALLLDAPDAAVATEAKETLQHRARILEETQWQTATVARWRAQQVLRQHKIEYVPFESEWMD